jgi:hypothetical protein
MTQRPTGGKGQGRYLLEFVSIGHAVKVSALDPATGTEVSIVGPANGGRELLSRTAVRKLEYVLNKSGPGSRPGIRV